VRNPFSRQDSSFVVSRLDNIPRPHGILMIAQSGRAGNATTDEPAHVSLLMVRANDQWCQTDLVQNVGRAAINISVWRDTALPPAEGIFRGWDLGMGPGADALLVAALVEATAIQARIAANAVTYSKYSSSFSRSWNCAYYAEQILRAAGLNVSAGFFVSSPLELTTGRSIISRMVLEKRRNAANPTPWYMQFQR
jgi:hypothetical protein